MRLRPTAEEREMIGPAFRERWNTYYEPSPDKPVMLHMALNMYVLCLLCFMMVFNTSSVWLETPKVSKASSSAWVCSRLIQPAGVGSTSATARTPQSNRSWSPACCLLPTMSLCASLATSALVRSHVACLAIAASTRLAILFSQRAAKHYAGPRRALSRWRHLTSSTPSRTTRLLLST